MMKLYLVRHGQATHNVKKVLDENPRNNTLLTEKGIAQVKKLSKKLKALPLEIIFSSQFPRCIETAKIINQAHKAPIKINKSLNERKTGMDKKSVFTWRRLIKKDPVNFKLQEGESFKEEKIRIANFLKILKKSNYNSVLIVSHGEPIQLLKGLINTLPDKEILKFKIRNASLAKYSINE